MGGDVWSGGKRRWKEKGSDASRHRSEVRRGRKRKGGMEEVGVRVY